MKKLLILLLILMIACSNELSENLRETANTIDDVADKVESVENKVETVKESLPEPDFSSLEYLENKLLEVYKDRGEVLNKKRELLTIINDQDIPFEDKDFYKKALGIVKERESELTLSANILDTRIDAIKNIERNQELLEAYKNTVEILKEDIDETLELLKETGTKILEIRQQLDPELELAEYTTLLEELKPLEEEEFDLLSKLSDDKKQLNETQEKIENIELGKSEDKQSLLLERTRISEELDVIRNELVEQYLLQKTAEGDEAEDAAKRVDDLEKQEDDLKKELYEVDKKLKI